MFLGLSDLDGITRISSSFFSKLAEEIVSERETEFGLFGGVSQEEEEEEAKEGEISRPL